MRQKCSHPAASWCRVHGDCVCPEPQPGEPKHLNDPGCPLHSRPARTRKTMGLAGLNAWV